MGLDAPTESRKPASRFIAPAGASAAVRFLYSSCVMKYKFLFMASAAMVLVAIVLVLIGFHGDAGVTAGSSLASNVVRVCGTTSGGWAIAALLSVLAGIVVFFVAVVKSLKHARRRFTPPGEPGAGRDVAG